jgi:hypothetical protein
VSPIFIGLAGLAQTPAQDSAAGPSVRLSESQMQTIYQSITKTQKNDPAPTGFRAAVGAILPGSITVMPAPGSVAELIPQTKARRRPGDAGRPEKQGGPECRHTATMISESRPVIRAAAFAQD